MMPGTATLSDRCDRPSRGRSGAIERIVARARRLRAGEADRTLRHRNIALLCDDPLAPDALLFCDAASGLGAQVAHVRAELDERSNADEIRRMATMLGRLYDAVECQGMPAALVGLLAESAAVPVFRDLSIDGCALGDVAPSVDPLPDRATMLALIQAMLLTATR